MNVHSPHPLPETGMDVDMKLLRSALARHRPKVIAARDAAVIACAIDPAAWFAAHQITLADHLSNLDKLESMCIRAEAEEADEAAAE